MLKSLKSLKPLKPPGPRGIALLESLVAIAILALGVLGLLGAQLRTLGQAQAAVHRAQAVRLVEDLGERLRTHPDASAHWAVYQVDWNARTSAPDCHSRACDGADLARRDLANWKEAVAQGLPSGQARVFDAGDRRLGVGVGWAARGGGPALDEPDGPARCPEGLVCHYGHVQP